MGKRCRTKFSATLKFRKNARGASERGGNSLSGGLSASAKVTKPKRQPTATAQSSPQASAVPTSTSDARAKLRRELHRWSVCKKFRYQFSLIARRLPPKKKKGGAWGGDGGWQPRLWRPTPIEKQTLGLAAVKHAQGMAARTAQTKKAFTSLAAVQTAARAEWPEAMKAELSACKTKNDQRAWSERWALFLSGQVYAATPGRPGGGLSAGGHQPS